MIERYTRRHGHLRPLPWATADLAARVLDVVIQPAVDAAAYDLAATVDMPGSWYRHDIAARL